MHSIISTKLKKTAKNNASHPFTGVYRFTIYVMFKEITININIVYININILVIRWVKRFNNLFLVKTSMPKISSSLYYNYIIIVK